MGKNKLLLKATSVASAALMTAGALYAGPASGRGTAQVGTQEKTQTQRKDDTRKEAAEQPHVIRVRPIEIPDELTSVLASLPKNDLALKKLPPERRTFQIKLFNDVNAEVIVDSVKPSLQRGYVVRGKIAGKKDSNVNLVTESGITFADIQIGRDLYEIRPTTAGQVVKQIDPSKLGSDDPAPGTPEYEMANGHEGHAGDRDAPCPPPQVHNTNFDANDETVTTFDVLIAYTPALKTLLGTEAAIRAMAQLAIDKANQAYQNSKIYQQARLADIWEAESDTNATSDFAKLYGNGDGKWDGVHAKRAAVKADIVQLITPTLGGSCGIARTNAEAATAMGMVQYDCISNHSLTHEMGHNMGAQHNREDSNTCVYDYAFGYRDTDNCFRDLMSYSVGCTERINYISSANPTVKYNNLPVGHATADNARALNERRGIVASFMTDNPLTLSLQGNMHDYWSVKATGNNVTRVEFYVDGVLVLNDQAAPFCLFGDNGSSCTLSRLPQDGVHTISAKSYNSSNAWLSESSSNYTQIPMVACSLQLNSPNGGEQFAVVAGNQYPMLYSVTGNQGSNQVLAELVRGTYVRPLDQGNVNGVPQFKLPTDIMTASDYKLRVKAFYNPTTCTDESDGFIAVNNPAVPPCTIQLNSFNNGETLQTNVWHSFQYSSTGNPGYVLAKLVTGSSSITLDQRTQNGVRQFKIPTGTAPGSNYNLRLISETNPQCYDDSNMFLTIP